MMKRAPTPANNPPVRASKKARRKCLVGGHMFNSEGPHNHVCDVCKSHRAWQNGGEDFAEATGGGVGVRRYAEA